MNDYLDKYKYYIFFVILLLLYFFLDYHSILFYRPQGIHFIRQTDGLSFVANYYNNGAGFFEPQVFNLTSTEGKAACEFPVLYFITAQTYKVFGEHEFILRLITIIIVSSGFFALFKIMIHILEDILYALLFTCLFLSSTILLYYTNNFLPDAGALGFILMGWYYFFLSKNRKNKYILISFLFFTLGSLIKVTYFVNPIAAAASVMVSDVLPEKKRMEAIRIRSYLWLAFLVSSLLVISWNLYAIHYNAVNKDFYFLVSARPVWSMERKSIAEVWDYIYNFWYSKYYYQSTIHFFIVIILAGAIFIKKADKRVLIPGIFLLPGSIIYTMLFYAQFREHDYYFIALIPTIIFLVITSFTALRRKFPKLFNNSIARILLLGLTVLSINYAKAKLEGRYSNKYDEFAETGKILSDIRIKMDSLGISQKAKIIIFTDKTPNGGLYFLNRKGWNIRDTTDESIKKIRYYKSLGADYLINTTNREFNYPKIWENSKVKIYKTE